MKTTRRDFLTKLPVIAGVLTLALPATVKQRAESHQVGMSVADSQFRSMWCVDKEGNPVKETEVFFTTTP